MENYAPIRHLIARGIPTLKNGDYLFGAYYYDYVGYMYMTENPSGLTNGIRPVFKLHENVKIKQNADGSFNLTV